MACQPHLRSAFPHAYQGYACVSCVPGSPRYPHPLTRLCVWRLPPARLLVDPGVPGSTFHKNSHGGDRVSAKWKAKKAAEVLALSSCSPKRKQRKNKK